MPQPFQYVAPPSNDLASSAINGLNLGAGIAQKNFVTQQTQLQIERQQQMRADMTAFANRGTYDADSISRMVLQYPELKDTYKQAWDVLQPEQQRQRLETVSPVFYAMQSGRPDLAESLLQSHIDSLKNSNGDPKDIQASEMQLKLIKEAPDHAQMLSGMFLASVMKPEEFINAYGKIGSEGRENAAAPGKRAETASVTTNNYANAGKTFAETEQIAPHAEMQNRDIQSQIDTRAGQLGLDRDKLLSETEVKLAEIAQKGGIQDQPDTRKLVNDAATGAVISANAALQMRDLANQFEQADPRSLGANVTERLKNITGQENYVSQLRKEYTRIRNTQVMALLPPGSASDKDVAFATRGFLPDTADSQEISSWLRGMATLQEYQGKFEDAKAQWAQFNGHLGRATKDLEIGDIHVAAGTTLAEFAKQVLQHPGAATSRQASPGAAQPAAKTNYMQKYGTTPANAATGRIEVPK